MPWSQVGPVRFAFAGVENAPTGWMLTLHIEEPAFSESRDVDGRTGQALLAFGMECLRRSEEARTGRASRKSAETVGEE